MATYTTNYNLIKPADADGYDIAHQNGNMDIIDSALNGINSNINSYNVQVSATGSLDTNGFLAYARDLYSKMSDGQSALLKSAFAGTYSIGIANRTSIYLTILYAPSDVSRIYKILYNGSTDTVTVRYVAMNDLG